MDKIRGEENSAIESKEISILFLDIRRFTNMMEIWKAEKVVHFIDYFFSHLKKIVKKYGGKIDKLIGDAMMAIFESDENSSCAKKAIECAREIINTLPTINSRLDINLKIGMGIATGEVIISDIAGFDSTVLGRCVNMASRIEDLCKEFGTYLIIDELTYEKLEHQKDDYGFRLIPDYLVRGTYERRNIWDVSFDTFDSDYIKYFNIAAKNYKEEHYSAALSFFIKAYSDTAYKKDRKLLHYFIAECFKKIDQQKEIFNQPNLYYTHSATQKAQADFLIFLMNKHIERLGISPRLMLDIGCGPGTLTKEISETYYPRAKIVGIDSSRSMIDECIKKYGKETNLEFIHSKIENFEYSSKFDVIFSNSTMHWIKDQEKAYKNIYRLMKQDSIIAVHQGHKDCYQQLRETASDVIQDLGLSIKFTDFSYPLVYHTKQSIKSLLENTGFTVIDIRISESENTPTLIDDFVEAGLLPYRKRLNEIEEEIFIKKFREEAEKLTYIDSTRLYFVAKKTDREQKEEIS